MVQPKIDALHETARDVAVVILQKHDAVFETGFAAEFVNFLDEALPPSSRGCALPAKINCTGRVVSLSNRCSRSLSLNKSAPRL